MVLPLLQSKLASELCCLEQILLLQAKYNQPPIPVPAAATTAAPSASTPDDNTAAEASSYAAAKQGQLRHWFEPHRYIRLTVLEQLLLAAAEGQAALLRFAADMRLRLETAQQKRGIKQTW
jgi:hypothetical protein